MIYDPLPLMKQCRVCNLWLPYNMFVKSKRVKSGTETICKPCQRQRSAEYRKQDPEKFRASSRRSWQKYGQERNEKQKEDRQNRPELYSARDKARWERRRDNPKEKAQRLKWEHAHAQERREYNRRWRERNIEHVTRRMRDWQRNNPSLVRINSQRHRTRKRHLPLRFTVEDWRRCLEYFNHRCASCGRPQGLWHTLAQDHWIPLVSPDCPGTVPWNIIPLCHGDGGCNNTKGGKDPLRWIQETFEYSKGQEITSRVEAYFRWLHDQSQDSHSLE
jgi:hypothetical protein